MPNFKKIKNFFKRLFSRKQKSHNFNLLDPDKPIKKQTDLKPKSKLKPKPKPEEKTPSGTKPKIEIKPKPNLEIRSQEKPENESRTKLKENKSRLKRKFTEPNLPSKQEREIKANEFLEKEINLHLNKGIDLTEVTKVLFNQLNQFQNQTIRRL